MAKAAKITIAEVSLSVLIELEYEIHNKKHCEDHNRKNNHAYIYFFI